MKPILAGRYPQSSVRRNQIVLMWLVFAHGLAGDARRASVRPRVGSLRLALGYKIQKSREKGPGGDAGPSVV